MSLTLVATPIGHPKDITLRALDVLKDADIVIGEERRVASTLLKRLGIEGKELYLLNEHSTDDDVRELADLCAEKKCALMSDAGTPGFCDPGSRLVALCRTRKISITAAPGPSSLATLLSLSARPLTTFVFLGFLPREEAERAECLRSLQREPRAVFLMDTPYRLAKTLSELAVHMPDRRALIGLNLTQEDEEVLDDTLQNLSKKLAHEKKEFVLLLDSIRQDLDLKNKKSFKQR